MDGKLAVKVKTPDTSVSTYYKDLLNPPMCMLPLIWFSIDIRFLSAGEADPPEPNSDKMGIVRLDNKQLLKVLACHQLMPSNVVACVFHEKALVLHIFATTLYVMYEIPHMDG